MFKLIKKLAFILFFMSEIAQAQSLCGTTFEELDLRCIQTGSAKFGEIKFLLQPEGELKENQLNQAYFYKTAEGRYGKFIIRSSFVGQRECSIFLDAVTFEGKRVHSPSATFTIKSEFNTWSADKVGFDETGLNDFELYRNKGKCIFRSTGAQGALYKKFQVENIIESNDLLYYAALFLIGLAVFLVARTVFVDEDRFKAEEKLEDADDTDKGSKPNDIVLKYSRPFFKRYFTPVVAGMKNKKKIREKYRRGLASSGLNKHLTPEDFFAFKLFLIMGFPIIYLGLREFLEEDWPLMLTPLVSLLGFYYPDFWIKGKTAQRQKEIIQNMPFVVDMLALSVEAGLDFVAAMQKVIEKAPASALVEEFETMIKETRVGASRAEGLRQMSWRIDTLPVSSFCATLIAADAVGASIGPILKTLASELRQKRSSEAEKLGAQAATKILFPMIFFILPAVGLIIAAPIFLEVMGIGK